MTDGWRFIAIRALTGVVLDWDLPLADVEFTRVLSASPTLRAVIDPADKAELLMAKADDWLPVLDMWSTVIVAEDPAGAIRFAGPLVQPTRQGSALSLECSGYFGWLSRQLYLGKRIAWKGGDFADPVGALGVPGPTGGIVRTLVYWAQSPPDAGMGIVVDGVTSSPLRVGTTEEPYEITPWEHPSVGDEISSLARDHRFDFVESHQWTDPSDPESTGITHRLTLHYPRAGRRRNDLQFQTGVNISADEPELADGDEYANTIVADGAGEGSAALRETVPRRDGRPRVMAAEDAQHVTNRGKLRSFAQVRAVVRATMVKVPAIQVIDHPAARLGSWAIGDDIFVQIDTDWGRHEGWHRIVGDTWAPDSPNVATLELEPAASFVYGGA